MEKDNVVRLLTIKESANESEMLAAMLRNAGYPVRSGNAEDEEDLRDRLGEGLWDIIISSVKLPGISAMQVADLVKKAGKDIPIVVTVSQYDEKVVQTLLESGIRDVALESNQKLMLLIIARELSDLRERRDHRQSKIGLAESEKRNKSLMESSRDAIAYIHEGMHIYINSSYMEMFGYHDTEELEGIPIMDLISVDDQPNFKGILKQLGKGDNPDQAFDFKALTDNGEAFSAKMEFSPASIEGEQCTQVIIRNTASEGSEQLQRELDKLKRQDLVTGLYNRNHYTEELEKVVKLAAEGKANGMALMQVELDEYQKINETDGAAVSDMLLTDFAGILKKCVKAEDLPARYAGDMFMIIYRNKDLATVEKVADALCKTLKGHTFDLDGREIKTTASVGIYQVTEHSDSSKKMLNHLDLACKKVKNAGGDAVHVHSLEDELAKNEEDRQWIQAIKSAIKNDGFLLEFQPIVSLHAEPGERYEVLIRLPGKDGENIPPGVFLGPAEQAGMMREVDRWVIKQTAKVLTQRRNLKKETSMFVKLSAESFKDQTLLVWISKLLKAARLHGDCLCFEAHESTVLAAPKETKMFVAGLKQLHCKFAVDHVGSESENTNYLKSVDVSYIKIAGNLVSTVATEEASQEKVKAISEFASDAGIKTIAQHVQDPNTLAMLWQYGVNFIQGNYLQPPDKNLAYNFSAEHEE